MNARLMFFWGPRYARMSRFSTSAWIVALALVIAGLNGASAEEPDKGPCTEDAMIVFDASGDRTIKSASVRNLCAVLGGT